MRSFKYCFVFGAAYLCAALFIPGFSVAAFSQDQGTPPSFTRQPTNQTVLADDIVTMTAAASGSPPLYYQWLFDSAAIVNATNASLTLTNVQGDECRVVFSGGDQRLWRNHQCGCAA